MPEGYDFTVSYTPLVRIKYIQIIIAIASAEGLIFFILDISNTFQNIILPNPEERVYISLPRLYLERFKINVQNIHYHQ